MNASKQVWFGALCAAVSGWAIESPSWARPIAQQQIAQDSSLPVGARIPVDFAVGGRLPLGPGAGCVPRNRNECGSLLLFPELDNRVGAFTLLTVTDGCCTGIGGATTIEVRFIDKSSCLETNGPITLTACDTKTILSRNLLGSPNAQGYAYMFARGGAPGLTPIVYNHLIGIETIVNGIDNFDYSINAVSFKAIVPAGGGDGTPITGDGDSVRDLNGLEYEEAPAQLVIPRFFGQSADDTFNGDLILIALSGGAAFNNPPGMGTVIRLTLFDKSGMQLGRSTPAFFCWEKRALRDWTASSLSTNPVFTPPGFPSPTQSPAGWILVDGVSASSTAETINDPAVYAVFVERTGSGRAADLPFEICSQPNGDLIPIGVLGDGPTFSNSDNQ